MCFSAVLEINSNFHCKELAMSKTAHDTRARQTSYNHVNKLVVASVPLTLKNENWNESIERKLKIDILREKKSTGKI